MSNRSRDGQANCVGHNLMSVMTSAVWVYCQVQITCVIKHCRVIDLGPGNGQSETVTDWSREHCPRPGGQSTPAVPVLCRGG